MKRLLFMCILCIKTLQLCETRPWNYCKERNKILEIEQRSSVGGHIELDEEETTANEILMKFKNQELDNMFQNPESFYFKNDFQRYKEKISKSKVYEIIKSMPKAGALHLHSSMILDADSLVQLTYEEHLYACFNGDDVRFYASLNIPNKPCADKWTLLEDLRNKSEDVSEFDETLKRYFLINLDQSGDVDDLDINEIWVRFDKVWHNIRTLLHYRPLFQKHYSRVLQHFYDDHVTYLEIRSSFKTLYELDGTTITASYAVNLLNRLTEQFKEKNPDFIGVRMIITSHRGNYEKTRESLQDSLNLMHRYPDFIVGFDVVGQEDKGKPLLDFSRLFADVNEKKDVDFYFHAGETNWYGAATDENLLDAILLNTKRIGHGFALAKHPLLLSMMKDRGIALEACVISNAVLGLVKDLRNHPAAMYIAFGAPLVLSSDDPGVWGADPLSDDFFVTFMAVASRRSDLRLLKQLALNSIKYSALDKNTKMEFEQKFENSWRKFITNIVETYSEYDISDKL